MYKPNKYAEAEKVKVTLKIDKMLYESVALILINSRTDGVSRGDADLFSEFVHSNCYRIIAEEINETLAPTPNKTK